MLNNQDEYYKYANIPTQADLDNDAILSDSAYEEWRSKECQ